MTKLSVNINKVSTLRNTRPAMNVPDLIHFGRVALEAGAHGLTIHPRPDERHIRGTDVEPLAWLVESFVGRELNIEGNPFEGDFLAHCRRVRPTQCTLVPDEGDQSTSDHGWDLERDRVRLDPVIAELKALGCRVSLFMDPLPEAMSAVAELGADRVELYTEPFSRAFARDDASASTPYAAAAETAARHRLGVNAGHDLNLQNLARFLKDVPHVEEVSIGHALIADALEFGLSMTVRRYLALMGSS